MTVLLLCFQSNVWAGYEPEEIPLKENSGGGLTRPRVQCIIEASSCNYSESEVGIQTYFRETIIRLLDLFHIRRSH